MRKSDKTEEAEKERWADAMPLALKMENGAMVQGVCRWALGKEIESPLEFPGNAEFRPPELLENKFILF